MQGESKDLGQSAGVSGTSVPATAVGFEGSWQRFRKEAAAVDARDVVTFNHNTSVVLHNVTRGATAVLAERAWFEAQAGAGVRVDLAKVADAIVAAEALEFTSARAQVQARPPAGVVGRIRRARVVLEVLQGSAALIVKAGFLKAAEVPVGADNGPRGVARACLRFVTFFRANGSRLRGLSPVDKALLEEAATLGATLLREVKPRGVARGSLRTEEARAAAADRDRMAVVVTRLYDYVERVAVWRWGRDCEATVPRLLSRDTSRGAADEDEVIDDDEAGDEDAAQDETDAARDEAADAEDADDADADETPEEPVVAKAPAVKKAAPKKPGVTKASEKKPAAKKTAAGR
jgi:hypothetical protein